MATSGTATITIGLLAQRKVEKVFFVDLDSDGDTTSDFDITLDTTFLNSPTMVAVPPISAAGTYTLTYNSATPKLSLAVSGDTDHASSTVPVIVLAYDKP